MKDTNPDHYRVDGANFIKYMDDPQIKGFGDWMFANGYNVAEMDYKPKTGKWERHYSRPGVYADSFWWCSCCGEPTRYNDAGIFYRYCPKCGAELEPCRED